LKPSRARLFFGNAEQTELEGDRSNRSQRRDSTVHGADAETDLIKVERQIRAEGSRLGSWGAVQADEELDCLFSGDAEQTEL
jgi:hypothetical protein